MQLLDNPADIASEQCKKTRKVKYYYRQFNGNAVSIFESLKMSYINYSYLGILNLKEVILKRNR